MVFDSSLSGQLQQSVNASPLRTDAQRHKGYIPSIYIGCPGVLLACFDSERLVDRWAPYFVPLGQWSFEFSAKSYICPGPRRNAAFGQLGSIPPVRPCLLPPQKANHRAWESMETGSPAPPNGKATPEPWPWDRQECRAAAGRTRRLPSELQGSKTKRAIGKESAATPGILELI
jgi:hypothetical protein